VWYLLPTQEDLLLCSEQWIGMGLAQQPLHRIKINARGVHVAAVRRLGRMDA
jgi:hypothetical protein